MPRNDLIQLRSDTAANWTSVNPTLAAGEMGFETDTGKLKIGTGSTAWTSLSYATTIPSDKPWNVAWGVVSYTSSTSSDTSLADEVEEVQLTGASFTAVSGRLYKVTYFEPGIFTNGGSGPVTARIRLTNISGTVLNECYEEFEVYYRTRFINLVFVGTIAAGTRNVVATLYYSGNTAYIGRGSERKAFLFVEDIGPS